MRGAVAPRGRGLAANTALSSRPAVSGPAVRRTLKSGPDSRRAGLGLVGTSELQLLDPRVPQSVSAPSASSLLEAPPVGSLRRLYA